MMFDFVDCMDKCPGQPWRIPIMRGYKLVTQLSTYTSCMLYHQFTAVFPRYQYTYISSRAACHFGCFRFYGRLLTVGAGSYIRSLHLQRCSELSGGCVVVGSEQVAYWMKHPSFCSILFNSHNAEVFVGPWFAAVEVKRWLYWNKVGSPEEEDNEQKWEFLRNI